MTEERTDSPEGFVADLPEEWWRDWRKLLAVALVVVAACAVAAVVVMTRAQQARDGRTAGARRESAPARLPSGRSADPTSSAAASPTAPSALPSAPPSTPSTPAAGAVPTSAPSGAPTGTATPKPQALVAFRRGGAIWVAAEDGAAPRVLIAAAEGAYALSPDGRTLAAVATGGLVLVDVSSASIAPVGPALPVSRISWRADSSALAYSAPASSTGDVMLVGRDGGGGRLLARGGTDPALSPDGRWLSYIDADRRARVVPLGLAGTAPSDIETRGATAACWGSGSVLFYATEPATAPVLAVRDVGQTGSGVRKLSSARGGVVFGDLFVSPDGKKVLFAERGDDGFSRTYVIGADGRGKLLVPSQRDTYPAGWSADGSRVLYFEGNAFQGQATRLTSARADGTGRVTIAEGATR